MKKKRIYIAPACWALDVWVEDRTLLTDASGSQFDDIGGGDEGGGDGWDIL